MLTTVMRKLAVGWRRYAFHARLKLTVRPLAMYVQYASIFVEANRRSLFLNRASHLPTIHRVLVAGVPTVCSSTVRRSCPFWPSLLFCLAEYHTVAFSFLLGGGGGVVGVL